MSARHLIIATLLLVAGFSVKGQSGVCDSIVPFFAVDLTNDPAGTWFSPDIRREGLCCTNYFPDRCVEFEIYLHPSAVGVIFDIAVGAEPPGALFYTINCGPEIPVGELACLQGPGPHVLTFCKPGANRNIYSIQSIPGRIVPDTAVVVEGCDIDLAVDGLVEETITWTDITSGTGEYEDLLTCSVGCDSTIFVSEEGLPDYVSYLVCGELENPVCQFDTFACDTVVVQILRDFIVEIEPIDQIVCSGATEAVLVSTLNGSYTEEIYDWYVIHDDGTITWLGHDSTQYINGDGTYGVIVFDAVYPNCRRDTAEIVVNFGTTPILLLPPDTTICENATLTLSASGADFINWYSGSDTICLGCPTITYPVSEDEWITVHGIDSTGCEAWDSFHISTLDTYFQIDSITICNGEEVVLPDSSIVSSPGSHPVTLTAVNGCDSVIVTDITVLPSFITTVYDTICQGDTLWLPDGTPWTDAVPTIDTAITVFDCDSVIQTVVTVLPSYYIDLQENLCGGEDYLLPNGVLVDTAGEWTFSYNTFSGCDSIINVSLSTFPQYDIDIRDTICDVDTYILPNGNEVNSPGVYLHFFQAEGGCDSIIRTYLTVIPSTVQEIEDTICAGEDYILPDGTVISTAGGVQDSFVTTYGCDSVVQVVLTLMPAYNDTLRFELCEGEIHTLPDGNTTDTSGTWTHAFNTGYGCDSIITTVVNVSPVYQVTIADTICEGEYYTLPSGAVVNSPGSYVVTFPTDNGCDSMFTVNLAVLPSYDIVVRDTICDIETYILPDGTQASGSGTWVHDLQTAGGCDSIITTVLTVQPSTVTAVVDTICEGESYTLPGGSVITASGSFIDTFVTVFGCDSVIRTTLYITPSYYDSVSLSLCTGQSYTLPDGTVATASGTWTHAYTTTAGCDSIYYTELSFAPEFLISVVDTICDVETYILPDGSEATASGIYTDSLLAAGGCDSIITIDLTILPSSVSTVYDTICQGDTYILPDGTVITGDQSFVDSFSTGQGCDNVITTYLTVLPAYYDTTIVSQCDSSGYTLPDGTVVTTSGTYVTPYTTSMGCDSIFTTIFTASAPYNILITDTLCAGQPYVLPNDSVTYFSGVYTDNFTSSSGCDSVVVTDLTVLESIVNTEAANICEGESYTLPDGTVISSAGVTVDSFYTIYDCEDIILTVLNVTPHYDLYDSVLLCPGGTYVLPGGDTVSGPGLYIDAMTGFYGCDSIITTEIFQGPYEVTQTDTTICEGQSVLLPGGGTVSSTGIYSDTLSSSLGCDSVVITDLMVIARQYSTVTAAICDGDSYTLPDGSAVTTAGTYSDTLAAYTGCDSVITTELSVYTATDLTIDASICDGETYILPDGSETADSGTYVTTFIVGPGCDSTVTVRLAVRDIHTQQVDAALCPGDTYTLPGGTSVTDTGTYTDVLTSIYGCDSVITTIISEMPFYDDTVAAVICEGESYALPGGQVVSDAGSYESHLGSAFYCDSVIITELTVLVSYAQTVQYTICENESVVLPDGSSVSVDTVIVFAGTSASGCDSTTTFDITVHTNSEYEFDYVVCGQESVTIGDYTYTESGTYTIDTHNHTGCDSTVIINLELNMPFEAYIDTFLCPGVPVTVAGQTFTEAGYYTVVYTNIFGCDSTYFVDIEYAYAPEVIAREDTSIIAGAEVEAYMAYRDPRPLEYFWYINDSLAHVNIKRFTETYMRESVVRVMVVDTNDCRGEDEFRIFVEEDCPSDLLFAPNIISPNFDNANDEFVIINEHGIVIEEVVIFNRWGERVYQAPDFTDPWDGTFRGQPCNPDVYTYYIQGTCPSGSRITKKGNITLIR